LSLDSPVLSLVLGPLPQVLVSDSRRFIPKKCFVSKSDPLSVNLSKSGIADMASKSHIGRQKLGLKK
jgi:hypothetical protein